MEQERRCRRRIRFVVPEYNFGPPPSLLNAFTFLVREWGYKPCAFVSYGGLSGGTRAVQVTKLMVTGLRMMPMVEGVAIPMVFPHAGRGQADASRRTT